LLAQEVAVSDALNDPLLRGQGFLPRFLFASATSLAGTRLLTPARIASKSYNDSRLQTYWQRCRDIQAQEEFVEPISSEVRPPVMLMEPEAEHLWMEFYNEVETQQGALGEYAQMRPFAGRAGELARRLSTVFAVFEQQSSITVELMRAACEIVRHSCREWSRYDEPSAPHPELQAAQALFDWLTDQARVGKWAEFDQSRLSSQGPTRGKAKMRKRLLGILTRHNYLLTNDTKHYRINPKACGGEQTAQIAQAGMNAAFEDANEVHTAAQKVQVTADEVDSYATLCNPYAPENPATTEPYADYALHAANETEKTHNNDAEYF
jgi:hypothetical protein